jgi:hypothetical protein
VAVKADTSFHIFRNNLPMLISAFMLVKAKTSVIRILSVALSGDCGIVGFWLLNCESNNCGLQQASEPPAPKGGNLWVFPGQPSSAPTLCTFSSPFSNISPYMCAYFSFGYSASAAMTMGMSWLASDSTKTDRTGRSACPIIRLIRWDEKAGLRRDAIRSP